MLVDQGGHRGQSLSARACYWPLPIHSGPDPYIRPQILQLYVASYQAQGIWKEAWKHLVGVISVQIIRDVEAFVARQPFADAEVMRFVMAS